ncbi:hypothetical protein DY000_02030868 [Brassica cretica]|uniref:Uncharacterized protein n=1 Tax=Brassica cretica TaxID=69181 RepID=A0ABQ7DLU7_BRACR|nr:hypothetical protein DY000_02030868 [Brassica cretica]
MVILEPFECRAAQTSQMSRYGLRPSHDVIPVLLKSGQSASREEAVEEMKDCRSMLQHCNNGIRLLLVEPLALERVIHKSKRVVDTLQVAIGSVEIQASIDTIHSASIDTVQPTSIDTVQPTSIDTIQPVSKNTVHPVTIHRGTVHPSTVPRCIVHPGTIHLDTVHQTSIDTVYPASIDTVHHDTVHHDTVRRDTVYPGTVYPGTVHHDTVHPVKNDTSTSTSIDGTTSTSTDDKTSTSIYTTTSSLIDSGHISEQKKFDVCGNLFDGETTTRSDKSRGKKRRNWKKRKRTKGGSQLSLIPHFSDGVRKSRVRSRCFSQPFAKLRELLIAEMIDKEEESMEEAFTQE